MENASMYNTADASGLDEFTDALDSISKKIDSGYYETNDNITTATTTTATTTKSLSDSTKDDSKLDIGKVIDVYREDMGIWYAATIIGIESKTVAVTDSDNDNDSVIETYVNVRYNGWGPDPSHDEVISILSDRIRPLGSKTDDIISRYQSHDSSLEVTQQQQPKPETDAKIWPCPYCGKIYNSLPGWRYHVEENKCRAVELPPPRADRPLGHGAIYDDIKTVITNYCKRYHHCLLYTSPSPRDRTRSRMPSSA